MEAGNRPRVAAEYGPLNRNERRKCIKRASAGEVSPYLALVSHYFDLVTEYLYLCNLDPREILEKSRSIFQEGWRRMAHVHRVSGWDFFLASSLMQTKANTETRSLEGRRPKALVELKDDAKFAFAASELEDWDEFALALALRRPPREIRRIRFHTKLVLLKIDRHDLTGQQYRCLWEVSADLDDRNTPLRQRSPLHRKFSKCEFSKDFRARWLDYRCHLIEMRQQIRLPEESRREEIAELGNILHPDDIIRPPLLARMKKMISLRPGGGRILPSASGPF